MQLKYSCGYEEREKGGAKTKEKQYFLTFLA